jgi:hypothetical protein
MTNFLLLATSVLSIANAPIAAAEVRPAAPLASQGTEAAARAPSQAAPRYCIIDQITGSRIPHKTCKTRAAWMSDDNFDPLAKQQ